MLETCPSSRHNLLMMHSVAGTVVAQLVFLGQDFNVRDQTWSNVGVWMWTQVVMNLSIITACIPSLKRVIANLQTGLTALTIAENMELSHSGDRGWATSSKTGKTETNVSGGHTINDVNDGRVMLYGHNIDPDMRHITTVIPKNSGNGSALDKIRKKAMHSSGFSTQRSSQEQLTHDGIMRTVEFKVEYEDEAERSEGGQST